MEFLGMSIITIILGVAGGVWLTLKFVAPRTENEWDDRFVDIVEGLCEENGIDDEELARKATGKLKRKIVKPV